MTPKKSPRVTLSIRGDLRRRINQIAHAHGMKHEIATRTCIIDELHRIAADDAVIDPVGTIAAYLKGLESA
ncbi:hypothetical protein QTH90_23880 [Variovorax sp. J2P1-59]|uniref:hypothetical protein n=1 Tax=Variovorax flavidus TaxID=3053501 RepID=UPI002576F976|nr:hypothetical protein [Variovorax sp. J2P1-59]MDM0077467.1 hypothetical protein [Variovorax sp. J2P1-59]